MQYRDTGPATVSTWHTLAQLHQIIFVVMNLFIVLQRTYTKLKVFLSKYTL